MEDIKLIRHSSAVPSMSHGNVDVPDDPSFPFKLEVTLRLQGQGGLLALMHFCSDNEEIIVRGMTVEALDRFIEANNLRTNPDLRSLKITGPDGEVLQEYSKKKEEEKIIVRRVKVRRDRTEQEILAEVERSRTVYNGWRFTTNSAFFDSIPENWVEEEVDVYFFQLRSNAGSGVHYSDIEEREYAKRGLVRDVRAQFQVNVDDPSFADEYPNSACWRNRADWVAANFRRKGEERYLRMRLFGGYWMGGVWFAGVRK